MPTKNKSIRKKIILGLTLLGLTGVGGVRLRSLVRKKMKENEQLRENLDNIRLRNANLDAEVKDHAEYENLLKQWSNWQNNNRHLREQIDLEIQQQNILENIFST